MDTRIECPTCRTSYVLERLGLDKLVNQRKSFVATIVCVVCKHECDVYATFGTTTSVTKGWRTMWREVRTEQPLDTLNVAPRVKA